MAATPSMVRIAKALVFTAASLPFLALVWDGFNGELGANPVETITRTTGDWALRLLLVTLAVTPLRRLTGWHALTRLRRMLGLFAFFYVALHFATYLVFDQFFSLAGIVDDVVERPYITVGFASFVLLIPLAATSTDAMVRRLGGRRWRRLHRLAYLAAAGGVLHFLWLVKADLREPLVYAAVLALLLASRLPFVSRRLAPPRAGRGAREAPAARAGG